MSPKIRNQSAAQRQAYAPIFAALGDETRLSLVAKLSGGQKQSITELSNDHKLTRQAITKHLRVLEDAGIVRNIRSGRESLFELDTEPINDLKEYLDSVSEQWDKALSRLKMFVED